MTARRHRRAILTRKASRSSSHGWAATPPYQHCLQWSGLGGRPPGARQQRFSPTFRGGGRRFPRIDQGGGGESSSPCTSMFIAPAGSELLLGIGAMTAPAPPVLSVDSFFAVFAPGFVKSLIAEFNGRRGLRAHPARCCSGAR